MTKQEVIKKINKCEKNLISYTLAYDAIRNLKNNKQIDKEAYDNLTNINNENFNKEFSKLQSLKKILEGLEELEKIKEAI